MTNKHCILEIDFSVNLFHRSKVFTNILRIATKAIEQFVFQLIEDVFVFICRSLTVQLSLISPKAFETADWSKIVLLLMNHEWFVIYNSYKLVLANLICVIHIYHYYYIKYIKCMYFNTLLRHILYFNLLMVLI